MTKLKFIFVITVFTVFVNFSHAQNCGVGTNVPQSKFEVKGDGTTPGTSSFGVKNASTGSDSLMFIIKDDGSVGIGTNTPTSRLHTVASGAKTVNFTGNLLSNTATSSTASITKYGLDLQSTGTWNGTSALNIGLNVNATGGTTNYAALFNGGNVGIGTSSPIYQLDLFTSAGNSPTASLRDADFNSGITNLFGGTNNWNVNAVNVFGCYSGSTGGSMYIGVGSGSSVPGITSWGINVGGSSPNTAILLSGSKRSGSGVTSIGTTEPVLQVENAGSSGCGGGTRMFTILGSGNVGIYTNSPAKKLEVFDNSAAQMRLSYTTGSVYTDLQTTSAGDLALAPTSGKVTVNNLHLTNGTVTANGLGLTLATNNSAIALNAVTSATATVGSSSYFRMTSGGGPNYDFNFATATIFGFSSTRTIAIGSSINDNVRIKKNDSGSEAAGGHLLIEAGNAFTSSSTSRNGGDVYVYGGQPTVSGTVGNVILAYSNTLTGKVGVGTSAPKSTFHTSGSVGMKIASKTATYTAADETIILCDATSASFTINLPASTGVTDRIYIIKKTDSSANTVTIDGNASETIDGATTKVISTQYDKVIIACDGSNWHVIN